MADKFDTDALRRTHLLSDYLPQRGIDLKRNGREWETCCPFHAENTPSFRVYPGKRHAQRFHCFGCGVQGDIIEFVQQWDGVEFAEACQILGGERTPASDRASASAGYVPEADVYADWKTKLPPPYAIPFEEAPDQPIFNPKRPEKLVTKYQPSSIHPYRDAAGRLLGYVLRIDLDGDKKITPTILWCRNQKTGQEGWCHKPMKAERRPMYRLDALAKNPTAQVLVFCGERKTDKAAAVLPRQVCVSFAGGDRAAGKTDWTPLAGRDVLVWPDNDESGQRAADEICAAAQAAGAKTVRLIARPGDEKPKGWDVGDAIAEGWGKAELLNWAKERVRTWQAPPPEPEPPPAPPPARHEPRQEARPTTQERPAPEPERKPQERPEADPDSNVVRLPSAKLSPGKRPSQDWRASFVTDAEGKIKQKLMVNFINQLQRHPLMEGVLAKNLFNNENWIFKQPPWHEGDTFSPRKITDVDEIRATEWLERAGLAPKPGDTGKAMMVAAEAAAFDPVRDYFESLKWDGKPRLATWLHRLMGVEPTQSGAERAFGKRWLIACVARNLTRKPDGEKVDTMLIFEGSQGKKKSTALAKLATIGGVRYFTDSVKDIGSKDTAMVMQSAIIAEIAELDALERTAVDAVKGWLSQQTDKYRPPYGRHVIDVPRRSILAGTVNPAGTGYLKDPTGARRFWPVMVSGSVDLDGIERARDQLWAEAVALYRQGEQWWLTDAEEEAARVEQEKRYSRDPWADAIDEIAVVHRGLLTLKAIYGQLGVPQHQVDERKNRRVIGHLVSAGYERRKKTVPAGYAIYHYVKPGDENDDEIQPGHAASSV